MGSEPPFPLFLSHNDETKSGYTIVETTIFLNIIVVTITRPSQRRMNMGLNLKFGSKEIGAIGVRGAIAEEPGSGLADLLEGGCNGASNENSFKYNLRGN